MQLFAGKKKLVLSIKKFIKIKTKWKGIKIRVISYYFFLFVFERIFESY